MNHNTLVPLQNGPRNYNCTSCDTTRGEGKPNLLPCFPSFLFPQAFKSPRNFPVFLETERAYSDPEACTPPLPYATAGDALPLTYEEAIQTREAELEPQ